MWLKYGEKADDFVCFDGIDQFFKYFFFMHATSFVIGKNSPAIQGWRKIVFMKPYVYFLPETILLKLFVKIIIIVAVFQ